MALSGHPCSTPNTSALRAGLFGGRERGRRRRSKSSRVAIAIRANRRCAGARTAWDHISMEFADQRVGSGPIDGARSRITTVTSHAKLGEGSFRGTVFPEVRELSIRSVRPPRWGHKTGREPWEIPVE